MVPLPTPRLLALGLIGSLVVTSATAEAAMLYVASAYFLCLAVLVVADVRSAPPGRAFEVSRHNEERLSLGEPNTVVLRVRWARERRGPAAHLRVRDEWPAAIPVDRTVLEGTVAPGGEWSGSYRLLPARRGDYAFGAVHLRVRAPLGLIVRKYRYPLAAAVKVYPNMQAVRRYELLARRGRLHETGLRYARLFGAGTEFERLRDYQPDDDYRRIAWKATARRRQPVTVEYETERSQNLMILLDTGRLMAAPIGAMRKLDCAVNAALMLAYMAGRLEDRIGLLAFSDRVDLYLPPRRGRRQFHVLLESLYKVETQPVESDAGRALAYLATRQHRRSLIVLFTDLEEAAEASGLLAPLAVLARHHLPLCVTVSDPEIWSLASSLPRDSRAAYERVVARRLLEERREVLGRLEKGGALVLDVPAGKLTAAVVNRYLEIKARARL